MKGWIIVEVYSVKRKTYVTCSVPTLYKRMSGILGGMYSCSYEVEHGGELVKMKDVRDRQYIYKTKKEADALVIKKLAAEKVRLREQLRSVSANLAAVEAGDL